MARRLLVQNLSPGLIELPADQAHHARDVLRLHPSQQVELFTARGMAALGILVEVTPARVVVRVEDVQQGAQGFELTIASAIPKGQRADWMIEKLAELGVARFIPLQTARSVVHPQGQEKTGRWARIAAEAAKQSRRHGVMEIAALSTLEALLERHWEGSVKAFLSTGPQAVSLVEVVVEPAGRGMLLIGPEGGWTADEETKMRQRDLTPCSLGATILRVETAAIAAAAIAAAAIVAAKAPGRPPTTDGMHQ